MKNEETLFLFAKAIKSLIKKQPLDKITVTDIVSTAGKTRQTFYRHFQDKYDLVNWYFEKLVLMPESFDLKLIKRIVAVNNQNVPERIESRWFVTRSLKFKVCFY